jgi:hypothetical protein
MAGPVGYAGSQQHFRPTRDSIKQFDYPLVAKLPR